MNLQRLFNPTTIAIVGASDRPDSYASQTLINLDAIGFSGEVWGINPKRDKVHGRKCFPSLADLPSAPDAVVVAIPAASCPEVIEQAGALGCGGAVAYGAGFAEVTDGRKLQEDLVAAALRHDFPVCGPNGNGLVAMHSRAALWGDALNPREPGPVGLISQSGNIAVNALASQRGLRFHTVISCGNQAVLSVPDYLEFLATQEGLRSIALYLEDDGDGGRLCEALAVCAETGVHVVVLKAGNSPAGVSAAAAHTDSLAGDQRVFRALVEEAGAHWAEDVHELLELSKSLASTRRVCEDGGLAILTCSGGDSTLGADEAYSVGLALPKFSEVTSAKLRGQLPSAATVSNPLDYTAMIWGDTPALKEIIVTVGNDPAVDQILVFFDQPKELDAESQLSWQAVREGIKQGAAAAAVPVMVSSTLPELLDDTFAWEFAQAGVATCSGLRTGLRCALAARTPPGDPIRIQEITQSQHRGQIQKVEGGQIYFRSKPSSRVAKLDLTPQVAPSPVAHRGDGNFLDVTPEVSAARWLAEHESKALLRAAGMAVVDGRVVVCEDDAVSALVELGGEPVAMKLSSRNVQHKSELGGVLLNRSSEKEVRLAYRELATLAIDHDGEVLMEQMAPPGVELFIAAQRDGVVPALIVGLGGIWTELLNDVAIIPLPATPARVERAIRRLRGAAMLTGGRGRPAVNLEAVKEIGALTGQLLLEQSLDLIELNPVFATSAEAVAVDALVRCLSGAPELTLGCVD